MCIIHLFYAVAHDTAIYDFNGNYETDRVMNKFIFLIRVGIWVYCGAIPHIVELILTEWELRW